MPVIVICVIFVEIIYRAKSGCHINCIPGGNIKLFTLDIHSHHITLQFPLPKGIMK